MDTKTFITLLQQPELLENEQVFEIEKIMEAYPFFQAPKALYLKGLKNQGSYRYNTALRNTAAYTTDRHVLFDFITSEIFRKPREIERANTLVEQEEEVDNTVLLDTDTLDSVSDRSMDTVVTMKLQEADEVLDPELFVAAELKEEESLTEEAITEEEGITEKLSTPETILQIDQPFEFDQNELHSFGEWMKLAALQPIQREVVLKKENPEEKPEVAEISKSEVSDQDSSALGLEDKYRLIDDFIAKNPKIGPVSSTSVSQNLAKQKTAVPDTLMTETLAKVYLKQKNYKKAIQAYNILILKNPEKSGFFADQIRAIKKLQDHK